MKRYGALFVTSNGDHFSVGPFDMPSQASEYGAAHTSEAIKFTGETPRIMVPVHFERYAAAEHLRTQMGMRTSEGHWIGEVTKCERGKPYGFITCASRGGSWFFSKVDDDGHDPEALKLGMQVSFTGSPHPTEENRYPRAYTIRVLSKESDG